MPNDKSYEEHFKKLYADLKKRKPNKTEKELEYDRLRKAYEEKFGVTFGYNIGGYSPQTIEQAIDEVRYCIEHNKMQERERYKDDGKKP